MPCRPEVLERVRVLRILAAADVPAGLAHAKLVPRLAQCAAGFAAIGARRDVDRVAEMLASFAGGWHAERPRTDPQV